jgi:two-component SAPR family response regulator
LKLLFCFGGVSVEYRNPKIVRWARQKFPRRFGGGDNY